MSKLHGKKIAVVGGSSGIGMGVARLALERGAIVVIGGRNVERMNKARSELSRISGSIKAHALNATDDQSVQTFFGQIGPIDHLVSTVGGAMGGGFSDNKIADIRDAVEHKVFDNLRIAQAAILSLQAGSSITFTGGTGGRPDTASGAYLGNSGILTVAEGLAVELAPRVRVNVVAPTWMETPLWRDMPEDQKQATRKHFSEIIPLGRTATIAEVASAYIFLMENDFITGQQIAVNGGVTLRS